MHNISAIGDFIRLWSTEISYKCTEELRVTRKNRWSIFEIIVWQKVMPRRTIANPQDPEEPIKGSHALGTLLVQSVDQIG